MRPFAIASCLTIAVNATLAAAGDPTTFTEHDFAPGTYTTDVFIGGGEAGGSSTVVPIADGGSPGPYLSIRHDLASGTPEGDFCARWAWTAVFIDGAVVDPAAIGGVGLIDWSIESLPIESGNTQTVQSQGLAIRQNGKVYLGVGGGVTPQSPGWSLSTGADLSEELFVEIINQPPCDLVGEDHPDFSPAGAPIELGFVRGNSTSVGGNPVATFITVGADAWSVTVHPAGPADCPADLNNDAMVGPGDLAILLAAWNTDGSPADLDGSGVVDPADLAAMLAAWGPCE